MDDNESDLEQLADELGCSVEALEMMFAERAKEAADDYAAKIATAETGTVACFVCGRDAPFRRTDQAFVIECDCGANSAGQVPESMIQHTRH